MEDIIYLRYDAISLQHWPRAILAAVPIYRRGLRWASVRPEDKVRSAFLAASVVSLAAASMGMTSSIRPAGHRPLPLRRQRRARRRSCARPLAAAHSKRTSALAAALTTPQCRFRRKPRKARAPRTSTTRLQQPPAPARGDFDGALGARRCPRAHFGQLDGRAFRAQRMAMPTVSE